MRLSDYKKGEEYIEFLSYEPKISERMIDELDSTGLPLEYLIEQNTLVCIQLLLRRSKTTFDAIKSSIDNENFIQLVLCVRSHFEVLGAIGHLNYSLDKYINGLLDVKEIDETINRMNLGFKPKTSDHPFESINVLTMIDSVDKILNKQTHNNRGMIRDNYSWLSEFCHPNSMGLLYSVDTVDKRKIRFRNKTFEEEEFKILGYTNISFPLFFELYDHTFLLIMGRENIPKIIKN